jgi:hypothetical protein
MMLVAVIAIYVLPLALVVYWHAFKPPGVSWASVVRLTLALALLFALWLWIEVSPPTALILSICMLFSACVSAGLVWQLRRQRR